ncbi:MAG TPA: nucleotidyltransferase family protein [Burkholderiaceae bacterium]|nr:nucleotidyltransferase family protein [Burkholderiaceae bacterium]
MKAMILAAGRGERMRPLTDHTPKPLLPVGGKPLIVWQIEKLVAAGMPDIVVNAAWLGDRLQDALGDGSRYGARLSWSQEDPPLETAGGIARALPLLGVEPFLVVNGDVWCDWDFRDALARAHALRSRAARAWLLLVDNPPHHPQGDFVLAPDSRVHASPTASSPLTAPRLTFSGIGVYDHALFEDVSGEHPAALAPLLRGAMQEQAVIGTHHRGIWMDIGTPERLQQLDTQLTM